MRQENEKLLKTLEAHRETFLVLALKGFYYATILVNLRYASMVQIVFIPCVKQLDLAKLWKVISQCEKLKALFH